MLKHDTSYSNVFSPSLDDHFTLLTVCKLTADIHWSTYLWSKMSIVKVLSCTENCLAKLRSVAMIVHGDNT